MPNEAFFPKKGIGYIKGKKLVADGAIYENIEEKKNKEKVLRLINFCFDYRLHAYFYVFSILYIKVHYNE